MNRARAIATERAQPAPGRPARPGQEGAALIAAVLLAAALAILAGAVGWFALVASQTSAAARDHAEVQAAVQTGLEIAAGALAAEPDIGAIRRGLAGAAARATDRLVTADGPLDVPTLTRRFIERRRRRPPPADVAVWHPYLWGRLGELAALPGMPGPGATARDPLVVVWIRGDDTAEDSAAGEGAARLEVAIEAVGVSGARAGAVAVVRLGSRGVAILAAWPDAGIAGPS